MHALCSRTHIKFLQTWTWWISEITCKVVYDHSILSKFCHLHHSYIASDYHSAQSTAR